MKDGCHELSNHPGPNDNRVFRSNSPFVAVILGSSRGIGRSTALAYGKASASAIVLTARNGDTLEVAVEDVKAAATDLSVDVRGVKCDVTSDSDIQALAVSIKTWFGRIGALVLSAGVATMPVERNDGSTNWPGDVCELNLSDFRRTFEVNFFGVVTTLKYLLPIVEAAGSKQEEGEGRCRSPQTVIVVTGSSIHHYDPKLMAMGYSLNKFIAVRFVEYVHWGRARTGVVCVGIQPGSVMTGTWCQWKLFAG
jgi:NAD(P)-dependent dehydrogenase (short-subunit alcohol dehydrogenase family)